MRALLVLVCMVGVLLGLTTDVRPVRSEVRQLEGTLLARSEVTGARGEPQRALEAIQQRDPETQVHVFRRRTLSWEPVPASGLAPGDEVWHQGRLLRVTDEGGEDLGAATREQLANADSTWTEAPESGHPSGFEWVLGLDESAEVAHKRLSELEVGDRFAYGGRIYELGEKRRAIRATNDVLGRVVNTFVRTAPSVIDAGTRADAGGAGLLTGTPNHPFWVDALQDYVPLGELEPGTVLHVEGGGEALLVSKTWRQGDFEVFDFEVQGRHNFYVSSGGPAGVLVHNSSTLPPGGSVRNVNVGGGPGRTLNCGNCAIATDAMLAGRPASALPGSLTSRESIARAFGKSARSFIPTKGAGGASTIMESWGDGARGIIYGMRADGSAHYFNAVNQKGTVRFLDGQSGGVANTSGFVKMQILRTDKATGWQH